ncbi:MAG: shikimate kinase [Deinococcales bacterium]
MASLNMTTLSRSYRVLPERPVTWVALVGFMGAGKSRIGWELSRRLCLNFVDTDKVIEKVSSLKIPEIFDLYGESTFRDYETEVLRRCVRLDEAVVSTGGGSVIRQENRELLKNRGPVVLLTASAETTYLRTRKSRRPLLEVSNPVERIRELLAARQEYYKDAANFSVSTDGRRSWDVVEEIVYKLRYWQDG